MHTMREILALAALAQCLVYDMSRRVEAGETLPSLHHWVLKENKWRAARFGLDTRLIENNEGDNQPITELIETTVADLADTAELLGCADQLADVLRIVANGNGATRQRREFARSGDLRTVVEMLIREWETDSPTGW